ncbi:MAG: S-layer homology domain-containing protein [Clostridia bacterium]|nr:S-layer homology domain-containing protein [Clostridia bacterium]
MKKRILSYFLLLVLLVGAAPVAFADALPFTDVSEGAWYYKDVKYAYDAGLVNGSTLTTYSPNNNLTYAEAVKLAVSIYQAKYDSGVKIKSGNPWYQPYVDYAKGSGIINKDYDWNAPATRADYMTIFYNAVRDEDLQPINEVTYNSIPDVKKNSPSSEAIYTLYRAGIVTGSDEAHSCRPESYIMRSEMAAILTRIMEPSARVKFSMGKSYVPMYNDLLAKFEKLVCNSQSAGWTPPSYLPYAIEAMDGTAQQNIGYVIEDFSGDGVPELIIAGISNGMNQDPIVYAVYTIKNDTPVLVVETSLNNTWYYGVNDTFVLLGKNSAISYFVGNYSLAFNGDNTVCSEFYYTEMIDGNPENIGCFKNTTGVITANASELTAMSADEYWDIENKLMNNCRNLELNTF